MRAFRRLFDRWYPRLVRYLELRVGDADQAEDLAQEAFVRLLERRPRNPEAWLFTVAANLATDHARVAGGRARRLTLLADELRAEWRHTPDVGPEPALLRTEEQQSVRRALATLSERDRLLLTLHADGVRYRDIARELAVAASSIGPLLARAQRRFAKGFASGGERGTMYDPPESPDERRASH